MKKHLYFFFAVTIIAASVTAFAQSANGFSSQTTNNPELKTKNSLKGSGVCFTPNKGQIADTKGNLRPDILYKGDGGGADVYLRKTGMSFVTSNMGEVMREIDKELEIKKYAPDFSQAQVEELKRQLEEKALIKIQRTDVDFENANSNPEILNAEEVEGYTNYYYAHCPNGITNVKSYNRVIQKNIYTGIDVIYYGGKQKGLKYDLVVNPGANPNDIQLKYTGAKVKLEGRKLIVTSELGETVETLPKVYQNINGEIVDVGCEYKLEMVRGSTPEVRSEESQPTALFNHYTVTFELRTYNHELPLIIDPYWATYVGGVHDDYIADINPDYLGNIVLTGNTLSINFPVGAGGSNVVWQGLKGGNVDACVIKFDPFGTRLWSTFYGGTDGTYGYGITNDNSNNIYITGYTYSPNFPVGAVGVNVVWQGVAGGMSEAFIIKFDPWGSRLWASLYGGSDSDYGSGITCDIANNVIITGRTFSNNFPVGAVGANIVWQGSYAGGVIDAFVVKFDSFGNRLWATFYGGSDIDTANDICCDNVNNILITGRTYSTNFPVGAIGTNVVWQSVYGGGGLEDAFVIKFNSVGSRLWATYYGGSNFDCGYGITCDKFDNVIIAGLTSSTNFPVGAIGANSVWQGSMNGPGDVFAVKLTPTGSRLWATFYGSIGAELIINHCLTSDATGNIYVLLENETEFAPSPSLDPCAYQPNCKLGQVNTNAFEDAIIVKFSSYGKKLCDTYFGGDGEDDLDHGGAICIYANTIYFTGQTTGAFPTTSGAFQTVFGGYFYDIYVASICANICESKTLGLAYTANTTISCMNTPVKFTPSVTNSCDTTGYKFHWAFTGGTPAVSDSVSPTVKFSGAGNYDVKLVVTTLCKKDSITKTNYITVNPCTVCNLSAQYTKGTANCSSCGCKEWIMVTGLNGTPPYSYN